MNISTLYSALFSVALALFHAHVCGEQNYYIRRFIVVQPETGLGCRISGVVSTGFLAYVTNRVLVIDWHSSQEHSSNFAELFMNKDKKNMSAVIYDTRDFYDSTVPPNANECLLDLTAKNRFIDFWGLINSEIWSKLDAQCDIIRLITDELFLDIVQKTEMGKQKKEEISQIRYLYGHFLNKTLVPSTNLKLKINHFLKTTTHRAKWMSIHSRGALDPTGELTKRAINCALQMLQIKAIRYIFFSSESKRLYDMAEAMIPPLNFLAVEKRFENGTAVADLDSHIVHQDHRLVEHWLTALEDWYLIGEADYCTTATSKSEYSTTALMRTGCKYVNVDESCMKVPDPNILRHKPKNMLTLDPKAANAVNVEAFYRQVKKSRIGIKYDKVTMTTKQFIDWYWIRAPTSYVMGEL